QDYHRRIAEALLQLSPDAAAIEPEVIATHFEGAGLREEAADYWGRAGHMALGRAANREAIAQLRRGLEQLKQLPETSARLDQELGLLLALAPALTAIHGWAAAEVEWVCRRARDLCERLNSRERLFTALWFLWTMHFLRGELNAGLSAAQEALAATSVAPELEVLGHHAVGFTRFFRGEFREALTHAERGIRNFDSGRERALVAQFQFSSTVALHAFRASSLWMLGRPLEAEISIARAMGLARELAHPPSLAFCMSFQLRIQFYARDYAGVERTADEMLALSQEEGFVLWSAVAVVFRGWSRASGGALIEGLEEMRRGLGMFRGSGSGLTLVEMLAAFAEILRAARQFDDAWHAVTEGLAFSENGSERLYLSELYRLKAELRALHQDPGPEQLAHVEAELRAALAVAREQRARPLYARAAETLARFLRAQQREADALVVERELARLSEPSVVETQLQ
ncbi:MAG: hypothetical protein RL701_1458, partial [Pseudomonadota bacterium]